MAYSFQKINELELVNEVPEGANVLIEIDGATKRLPSSAIKPAGGGVTVYKGDNEKLYHYDIETGDTGDMVTDQEFRNAFNLGPIYVTKGDGIFGAISMCYLSEDIGGGCYVGVNDEYFYTAEHAAAGPV